ncbi:hypothetical protein CAPTEDRAFT_226358 [Capitella teleta]|uniref:C2H2-type domain-containing protein n=1 Tax=Capitella teleta TaxID=283909 RepID=R7UZM4_CAPTE|nr:hypothetical protein CAPTEDRAFT_226358 [Capitella teleta]|eukprot:ELU11682.1 hypothetical protein CAPTEDRAFT_226358 [Capitella teleta]
MVSSTFIDVYELELLDWIDRMKIAEEYLHLYKAYSSLEEILEGLKQFIDERVKNGSLVIVETEDEVNRSPNIIIQETDVNSTAVKKKVKVKEETEEIEKDSQQEDSEQEGEDIIYDEDSDADIDDKNFKRTCSPSEGVVIRCSVCQKTFSDAKTRESHLMTHQNICENCGKIINRDKKDLQFHSSRKCISVNKNYSCRLCSQNFANCKLLQDHHDQRHIFGCKICKKSFGSMFNLREHSKTHNKKRVYQCPHCKHSTHREALLKTHINNCHSERKLFACEFCDAKLKFRQSYDEHLLRHFQAPAKTCEHCGKAFYTASALATHKVIHKPPSLECNVCHKRFSHRTSLQRHLRLHDDRKTFKCSFCSHSCKDVSNLRKHERNMHQSHVQQEGEGSRRRVLPLPWLSEAAQKGDTIIIMPDGMTNDQIHNVVKEMQVS